MHITDFLQSQYPHGIPEEITFYGGSFNPWHEGHSESLRKVHDQYVIVIPDRNPLKASSSYRFLEDQERIQKQLGKNQLLYTGFMNLQNPNPTQVWVREIRQLYPELKINFLMGFDNFVILDRWFSYQELLKDLSKIYILSRNDCELKRAAQIEKCRALNPELELVFLGSHPYEDLSSTKIREAKVSMFSTAM
jgi:nicotinate-nucleotide adenylyltransferase